ncbi:hypothetical protein BDZ90DRAFT_260699 [Jaminaea rosea]|uniref:Ataxin-10 homolog n=1 Tax=Jaminaea rosea TaxID=1569628 RepID=A0A316UNY9_9BASI|nr:hypothetical protein BDZ90DRAFT_260699 [Jaminaea rosea]PWN27022.1 hypothetical protein BDZ90DRAFT_260699 [Jaminaea rosea]
MTTSSTSVPAALKAFLRDGLLSEGSSPSSSSSSPAPVRESDLLLALQQASSLAQTNLEGVREELLPLLALRESGSGSPRGAAVFAPLWKSVFEIKAKEPSGFSQSERVQIKVHLSLLSSRLLRNLVAGHPQAQQLIFDCLCSDTLALLRLGSSLAFSSDPEIQPLVRTLVQLLCNMVTMHKNLQKALFHKLRVVRPSSAVNGTASQEATQRVEVLQNLLASPDAGTVEAVQVLLLNCIKSSATNSTALAASLAGRRLLGQLLHLFETTLAEDDEGDHRLGRNGHSESDEDDDDDDGELEDFGVGELDLHDGPSTPASKPRAQKLSKHKRTSTHSSPSSSMQVTVGYAIFAHLFEIGLFRHMYRNLGPACVGSGELDGQHEEIVTTEQTLLLKTVDAWINAGGQQHTMRENSSMDQFGVLVDEFARLATFIRGAISQHSAGHVDRRLLGVHAALVLVLENLIQLGMIGCEGMEDDEQFRLESEEVLRRMRTREFVEAVVELLRAVGEFAPAISPFTSRMGQNGNGSLPEGHAHTSTGLSGTGPQAEPDRPRLDHLNRALVQLLGVLVFQHSPSSLPESFKERSALENAEEGDQVRAVQDLVRESGGLLLVLGMTKLDVSNPYIREHAVFTLRYLLQGNAASQELVGGLRLVDA